MLFIKTVIIGLIAHDVIRNKKLDSNHVVFYMFILFITASQCLHNFERYAYQEKSSMGKIKKFINTYPNVVLDGNAQILGDVETLKILGKEEVRTNGNMDVENRTKVNKNIHVTGDVKMYVLKIASVRPISANGRVDAQINRTLYLPHVVGNRGWGGGEWRFNWSSSKKGVLQCKIRDWTSSRPYAHKDGDMKYK